MIILQAGQTIPDPNIFCDPQHFGENFTVWATQRTVFYPNFFCDPQHFGGNCTVWATQRTVFHPNFFVITKFWRLYHDQKRKNHCDHERTKCLLTILSYQSVYL